LGNESFLEKNKAVVLCCIEELWNCGDLGRIDELVDPSFIRHHERNQDGDFHGRDGFRAWLCSVREALPDMHLEIVRMFGENDRVMVHLRGHGTHRGALKGVIANGTALTFTATSLLRIADGKVAECWVIADTLGLLQQVGAVARTS
jgi:steroid delta-isomerase-like uncharacterized protein